ncbi:MAG: TolC family protein [Proteobacteria bacterium]|nr:TolC family protein [Pseudomonadota bacterium]
MSRRPFLAPCFLLLATFAIAPARAGEPPPNATPAAAPAPPTPAPTAGHRYALGELIARAQRHYPGVAAAEHAVAAMEQKLFQARWAWLPRGELNAVFAPTPEIRCFDDAGNPDEQSCVRTNIREIAFNLNGVFGRAQLELGMPLYTFGKLSAVGNAARAGVALEQARLAAARRDLELNVTKAYWGAKLASAILEMIHEGREHLDKASARLTQQLEDDSGDATVTDELRLKTYTVEIDTRTLEARKLQQLALRSLSALTGLPADRIELDDAPLEASSAELLAGADYQRAARQQRPEMHLLEAALSAVQARSQLERARLWPDLLLVGRAGIGRATNVDFPQNAFLNNPFNFSSAGLALTLHWQLDTVQQIGRLREALANGRRLAAKRQEALTGMKLEIEKVYLELQEAQQRLVVAERGHRSARSWLVATSQNLSAGLAEPKELTDALVAYFRLRLTVLQAIFDVNVGWSELARKVGLATTELTRTLIAPPAPTPAPTS